MRSPDTLGSVEFTYRTWTLFYIEVGTSRLSHSSADPDASSGQSLQVYP